MAEEHNPLAPPLGLQDLNESTRPQGDSEPESDPDDPDDPDDPVAGVAERLESTGLQAEDVLDESVFVPCDSCPGGTERALKTCCVCLASYCGTHLRMHEELHAGNTHTLVDAGGDLQLRICSKHHRLLEVFCRTDQQCVCCLCTLDTEHRGHDTRPIASERAERQRQLENSKRTVTDRETELKEIQKAPGQLRNLAQATEEESDRIFSELLGFLQRSHAETLSLIQTKLSSEIDRTHTHLGGLEQEIAEMKRTQAELEQISHTADHLRFLREFQSRWSTSDLPGLTTNPQFSFGEMIKSLSSLTAQIEDIWRLETTRIFSAVTAEKILLPLEPKTREDFLQFLVPLSLDPDTAHRSLRLSEQGRAAVCGTEAQSYPEGPERFSWWAQVLSRDALSGRCYWEAEWTGRFGADLALAYGDISRDGPGDDCGFGYNTHSWSLDCSRFRYVFVHNNEETEISAPLSRRVGVFLDHRAGLLSFYSVSEDMLLLHREHARFTQPLYAGFGLFQGSSARFADPQEKLTMDTDRSRNKTRTNQRNGRKAVRKSKYLRCGMLRSLT